MSKRKTKEEWMNLFKMYEVTFEIPKECFETINFKDSKAKYLYLEEIAKVHIKQNEKKNTKKIALKSTSSR